MSFPAALFRRGQNMDKDKFLNWCVTKRNLVAHSMKHTRIRYDYLFRWLNGEQLNAEKAEGFILHLREKNLRNSSINSYIRVINLIDIYERDHNKDLHLLKNISYLPKEKTTPTFLNIEEVEALIGATKDYSHSPWRNSGHDLDRTYRDSIWFLAGTGCRFDEMAQTQVKNLFLGINSGYVKFPKEIVKTKQDRVVPLPPLLVAELKDFLKNKKPNDLMLTTSAGHKISEQTFNPELRKRAELAGINKHVHSHMFRHSYIRELRRHGVDVQTVALLVGHEDLNTTLSYDKFDYEEIARGAENHPLFSRTLPKEQKLERYIKKFQALRQEIEGDPDRQFLLQQFYAYLLSVKG